MKKISLSILLIFNFILHSQDIINMNSGEEIYSQVLKISDTEVEFKKFSNLEGPTYTKKISDIANIKYKNGTTEVFTKKIEKKDTIIEDKSENNSIIVLPPDNDGKGIAKVNQVNGVDIYFMSRPLLSYKIVFNSGDLFSDIDLKSIFWGGMVRAHVNEKMEKIVNAAYRKSEREKIPIHGVLYTGGNKAVAIQYVETEIPADRLAKVDLKNDVEIYVLSIPYKKEYEIVKTASAKSGGFTSMVTNGLVNSSMDDDIQELLDRLNIKKLKPDGVIYLEGKKGNAIKFK